MLNPATQVQGVFKLHYSSATLYFRVVHQRNLEHTNLGLMYSNLLSRCWMVLFYFVFAEKIDSSGGSQTI